MSSIRQNSSASSGPRLPDFANQGVWLRILLGVNLLMLLAALAANQRLAAFPGEFMMLAGVVELPLIATVLLLYALNKLLQRLPGSLGALLVIGVALATTAATHLFGTVFSDAASGYGEMLRALCWAALAAGALLWYFDARQRQHSPALAEARLMALTARIRPHFLFNSLNAVLGVIRSEPRRAEEALEELSDLFRVLMRENRELVPLSEEIALARQYLSLERLRLGDRLRIRWDIESCPPDALMPPLMLQPLLENAVYHGIEPLGEPGEIAIVFSRRGDDLLIEMTNPCPPGANANHGNQMALANIRERLMLFYDLEARLEAEPGSGCYTVRISIPYRHGVPR
jgi:two-component system sensor histidine kinase AlgZ